MLPVRRPDRADTMTYRATVEHLTGQAIILSVERNDGAGLFSDQVHHSGEWRPAADERLALAGWRVIGEWRWEVGRWKADAEPAE